MAEGAQHDSEARSMAGSARSIVGWGGSGLSADQVRFHKQANYADNHSPLKFLNERQPRFHFGHFMMHAHISFSSDRCILFAHLRFQQSLIQCFVNRGHYLFPWQMLTLPQLLNESKFPLQPDSSTYSQIRAQAAACSSTHCLETICLETVFLETVFLETVP